MKNSTILKSAAALMLVGAAATASANESALLVTNQKGAVNIELLNESNVSALQFDIDMPNVKATAVNSSSCVSGLPSSHSGSCVVKDGRVRVVIFSMTNATLPTGSIGELTINGQSDLKVSNVLMGDAQGQAIKSDVLFDSGEILRNEKERR